MSSRGSLSEKKLNNEPRFAQLFEDAKRRKILEAKRDQIIPDSECTFAPNIDLTHEFNSTELSKRRLYYPVSAEKLRQNRKLKSSESEVDLITGQPLYRPLTGRAPKNRSKSKAENIGDYLYAQKIGLNKSHHCIHEGESENATPRNRSMVHDKSNQLVEKLRKDCFAAIFGLLDADNDGIISPDAIAIESVPREIAEIYQPVLNEMYEMKCTLNLEEFIDTSNNLFRELTITQRNELINFYKSLGSTHGSRSFSTEEYSFKPCISQRSRELADKKAVPGVDLVTKLLQLQKLSQAKLEKLRRESENAKLEGCSFRPQISPVKDGIYDAKFSSPIR